MVICRLPFVLLEAALYCCLIYFWVGFYLGAGYFFLFYIILVSTMLVMAAINRLNASASPDLTVANAIGEATVPACAPKLGGAASGCMKLCSSVAALKFWSVLCILLADPGFIHAHLPS